MFIDKNISVFCIISSNVTLLFTELLGQFKNFLNTPRNHQFMYINKIAFHPFFIENYLFTYYSDAALFDLFVSVPSTIFQLYRDGSSWVEPVLS